MTDSGAPGVPDARLPHPSERLPLSGLALSGVTLAAVLVQRTANGHPVDQTAIDTLLRAVPTHRAESPALIFPNPGVYREGARIARDALSGRVNAPDAVRYSVQLIELANLLRGVPQVVEKLRDLLDQLHPDSMNTQDVARIYQQTISTLGKRIQVTGDPALLGRDEIADRIRALLLAGIRMAWLWYQCGGRRWHLVLQRRALAATLHPVADPPM